MTFPPQKDGRDIEIAPYGTGKVQKSSNESWVVEAPQQLSIDWCIGFSSETFAAHLDCREYDQRHTNRIASTELHLHPFDFSLEVVGTTKPGEVLEEPALIAMIEAMQHQVCRTKSGSWIVVCED